MKCIKFFCLSVVTMFLVACSHNEDCLVADSLEQVHVLTVEDKSYYLFVRTTGFNEKAHFYELYAKPPAFDVCGKTTELPLTELHIDDSKGGVQKLILKNKQLIAVYSEPTEVDINLLEVPIEVQ